MKSSRYVAPNLKGVCMTHAQVKLIHATPKGDELVAYMARVNPEGQDRVHA